MTKHYKKANSKQILISLFVSILATHLSLFFGMYLIIGGDFVTYFSNNIVYTIGLGTFFVLIEVCVFAFVKERQDLYVRVFAIGLICALFMIIAVMVGIVGRNMGTVQ